MNANDYMFRNREGEILIKAPGSVRGNGFVLDNLKHCEVYVLDHTSQVQVDDCINCNIFIGPTDGSVFLRDCRDCTLCVASRQLRTRDCKDLDIALYCATQPSIETSTGILFSCWRGAYPGLTEHFKLARLDPTKNTWMQVYDFNSKEDLGAPHFRLDDSVRPWWTAPPLPGGGDEGAGRAPPDCPVPATDGSLFGGGRLSSPPKSPSAGGLALPDSLPPSPGRAAAYDEEVVLEDEDVTLLPPGVEDGGRSFVAPAQPSPRGDKTGNGALSLGLAPLITATADDTFTFDSPRTTATTITNVTNASTLAVAGASAPLSDVLIGGGGDLSTQPTDLAGSVLGAEADRAPPQPQAEGQGGAAAEHHGLAGEWQPLEPDTAAPAAGVSGALAADDWSLRPVWAAPPAVASPDASPVDLAAVGSDEAGGDEAGNPFDLAAAPPALAAPPPASTPSDGSSANNPFFGEPPGAQTQAPLLPPSGLSVVPEQQSQQHPEAQGTDGPPVGLGPLLGSGTGTWFAARSGAPVSATAGAPAPPVLEDDVETPAPQAAPAQAPGAALDPAAQRVPSEPSAPRVAGALVASAPGLPAAPAAAGAAASLPDWLMGTALTGAGSVAGGAVLAFQDTVSLPVPSSLPWQAAPPPQQAARYGDVPFPHGAPWPPGEQEAAPPHAASTPVTDLVAQAAPAPAALAAAAVVLVPEAGDAAAAAVAEIAIPAAEPVSGEAVDARVAWRAANGKRLSALLREEHRAKAAIQEEARRKLEVMQQTRLTLLKQRFATHRAHGSGAAAEAGSGATGWARVVELISLSGSGAATAGSSIGGAAKAGVAAVHDTARMRQLMILLKSQGKQ